MTDLPRVLVCGGRDYGRLVPNKIIEHPKRRAERKKLYAELDALVAKIGAFQLIHGGAKGADALAGDWALVVPGLPKPLVFEAAWNDLDAPGAVIVRRASGPPYNKLAGFTRNQKMIDEGKPDLVVAFPGGSGTADMVKRAEKAGITVERKT